MEAGTRTVMASWLRDVLGRAPAWVFLADPAGLIELSVGGGVAGLCEDPAAAVGIPLRDVTAAAPWLVEALGRIAAGQALDAEGPIGGAPCAARLRGLAGAEGRPGAVAGAVFPAGPSPPARELVAVTAALEQENRFQAALMTRASEGLCVCQAIPDFPHVRFTLWNDRMREITGYTLEEINRLGWYQSLYPDPAVRERAIARMASMREGDDLLSETWVITRADGEQRTIEISTAVVRVDGSSRHVLGVMRDITEQRRAEAERDRLLAEEQAARRAAVEAVGLRDEFLSIASHELYTPLASLVLAIQGVEQAFGQAFDQASSGDAPPRALIERMLGNAARQVRRLTRLVGSLLDVSRIEAGRLELAREDVDLAELLGEVIDRLEQELARAGCAIERRFEPVRGRWDRLRLEQVFTNLLANALRYGAGKPIAVRAWADEGRAQVTVTDHGIGIDPARVRSIFDRFERAAPSRNFGGLGLGLYICRWIVHAHGGSIDVTSSPGAGSTFRVELPLAPPGAAVGPGRGGG